MTTPTLSVSIPAAKVLSNGTTTKYFIKSSGDIVPEELGAQEEDSDASSICHSPGWEDASAKKRKKEKREAKERKKREKEKAEAAAKLEQKLKNRLTKAPPPAHKRLSKMAIFMDRSISEPVADPKLPEGQGEKPKEEPQKAAVTRSRRGSLEMGLKSFIQATHVPVPWKSSNNTPAQTTPAQENPSSQTSPSTATGGFIGGLKFRQVEDAKIQETIRIQKQTDQDSMRGLLTSDRDLAPSIGGVGSSRTSITESIRPATSIYEESIRTPEQWDAIYAKAAKLASSENVPDTTPIMERNIRKSRRTHAPPPTSRFFPPEDQEPWNTTRDISAASTSRNSITSGRQSSEANNGRRPSSEVSGGQQSGSSVEQSESREAPRGRASSSYVRQQRQQSRDRSIFGFRDEDKVSEATIEVANSRPRLLSFRRSRSRVRTSNDEPITTQRTRDSADVALNQSAENPLAFLNSDYTPPLLELASPMDKSPDSKSKAMPGLKGLKSATKAAFSRHMAMPDSPSGSFSSLGEGPNISPPRPRMSKRAATTGSVDVVPSKAERDLGASVQSPVVKGFAEQPSHRRLTDNGKMARDQKRSRQNQSKGTNSPSSHSRSMTDSSVSSTLDESSSFTTPTASRPNSHKRFPPMTEVTPKRPKENTERSTVSNSDGFAMMTGAIPIDDIDSGRDSWCQTARPLELTEDEDRMKTPTGKKTETDFSNAESKGLNSKNNTSDLQRQPSLSRSMSTPEMQDLSFLPTLKHQALTRPQKEKGKVFSRGNRGKQSSTSKEREESTQKALPSIPHPSTKSEGSSPTSPISSQYLQNARLNIPRPPPKSGFPHSHNPHQANGGPEPIAKMFVICCSCKYFHDMPSKIYECMAKPENVVTDTNLGVSGVISTSVKCPWCGHGMGTKCCAGYAAVVYLKEKMH
jgi:hypothetical protein